MEIQVNFMENDSYRVLFIFKGEVRHRVTVPAKSLFTAIERAISKLRELGVEV